MNDIARRPGILLIVGLVLALFTAVGLYGIASGQAGPGAEAKPPSTSTPVVVAAADIPARTLITVAMVTYAELPVDVVPETAARLASDVVGQTTAVAVPKGAFMLTPQLIAAGGQTGQSVTIEPGKVLVAFPTTDPLTSAGLVQAGDRVDLLATIVAGGEARRTTQTTIQDLEVIQVLGPTEATPGQSRALTFVVDHQVALFLKFLRDHQASVEIAVRSRGERDVVTTQHVNVQVLEETFGFR